MRDLIKTRAVHVQMAALDGGWAREAKRFIGADGGAPMIRWHGPDGLTWVSDDPEALPEPLCQAKRVELIGVFSRRCRLCDAEAQWLTEEQLAMVDPGRAFTLRFQRHRVGAETHSIEASEHVFVIEHAPGCDARPAAVSVMDAAAAN